MTFSLSRTTVRVWAYLMMVFGFGLLVVEAWIHYCRFFTPLKCTEASPWSFVAIIVANTCMIVGALMLQKADVDAMLGSIGTFLGPLGTFVSMVKPVFGGRRTTDTYAVPPKTPEEVKEAEEVGANQLPTKFDDESHSG